MGKVFKRICDVISKRLREGWIKRAVDIFTGGFLHNHGPQLKCVYELHIQEDSPV